MKTYATIDDLAILWRTMTEDEQAKAESLLPLVSSSLRFEAKKAGCDLDAMVEGDEDLAEVAKSVTCDVVARNLMTSTDSEPLSQFSQSAGGYTVSGTYLIPGGGIYIKKSELARLGLRRQRLGVIDLGQNQRDNN